MYILMMVLSLGMALIILRLFSFHHGIYNGSGIKSISGLRALLASIVAFSHFAHYVYSLNHVWIFDKDYFAWLSQGNFFANSGKFGVALFFMISAFLFYRWLDNDKLTTAELAHKLLRSRIRRIVPMFWFSALLIVAIGCYSKEFVADGGMLIEAVRWFLFIGNYHIGPIPTANINAGVEWTLRLEWLLYLSIPLIYALNRATGGRYKTLLIMGSIGGILVVAVALRLWGTAYTDPRPVLGFAIGYLAWHYRDRFLAFRSSGLAASLAITLTIIALFFTSNTFYYLIFLGLLAVVFFIVSSGNSLFGVLESKTLMSVGEVSYSLYLIHGIVLYFIKQIPESLIQHNFFLYTLLSTLFFVTSFYVAKLTYIFVEKPFIHNSQKKKEVNNASVVS
ncbi:acyltransferase family protein [Pantoea anthophila]|uniref:acyltransferase family protein n=1 Tax=Pantoea anthophila TaxID=470931 RepID=UPI00289BCAE6|nr:acyltransferase [Pantoea anthophila]